MVRTALTKTLGAVIVGPAGIGKTRLAGEALAGWKGRVWWLVATRAGGSIPFAPFVSVVPDLGEALVSGGGSAAAYAVVRKTLLGSDGPSVLVVDDAHLLDPASAATTHDLARNDRVAVLATIRGGEPVPDAITALWKDVGLARMELGPLNREEAEALCESLLSGPVEARTLAQVWRLSQGNPMEIRELVLSAQESGVLRQAGGIWTLSDRLAPTSRLIELVGERLGRLDEEERIGAETLAYGEPLDIRLLLNVVERDVVERLERARVFRVGRSGDDMNSVSLAHPLYGEVLRATLPESRRSMLAGRLSDALTQLDRPEIDPLRAAVWRLESGLAGAEELANAARDAVGRMAWDLALRFGSAALELEESYLAHTAVAAALAEEGKVDEAEQHLLRAKEITESPLLEAWAYISLGDLWFYHAGRMEEALELVRKRIDVTTDPEIRDDLVGALAVNLMMYGDLAVVEALAREVMDGPESSSRARLMALVASTLVDGLMLRSAQARQGVEVALTMVEENRARFPNAEDLLHGGLTLAHIGAGEVAAVRRLIDQRRQLAVESDRADLPGFWGMLHGQLLLYEGLATASYAALVEALLLLERFDSWLSTPLAQVEAAHSAAVMGLHQSSREHLAMVDKVTRQTPRIRSRFSHVSAWITANERGLTAGATEAVAAGDQAAEDHHLLWAVEAWHLAVRLGSPELAKARLVNAVEDRQDTVASLYADHARALMARDVETLDRVALSFHRAGFALLAAEAACQIAGIYRRSEEGMNARRYAALAREMLPDDSGAMTPPFAELPDAPPLTAREREVALLAATGITSREIADRLFISVRSVDNHLARVYLKLGINGRAQLGEVLAPVALD